MSAPEPSGRWWIVASLLLALGAGWLLAERFWWYPRSCDDPGLRAQAPVPTAVWVGGMDGEYVECSRRAADEGCPVRCRTFTLEGETNSEGCAACSPASACEAVDLSRCDVYEGFDDGRLCFTNGACLAPTPGSTLEL